jgi:HSP20 family protein
MADKVPVSQPASAPLWPAQTLFKPFYDDMQKAFEGLLTDWPAQWRGAAPLVRIDCSETPEAVELTAELPGLNDKDVAVELAGDLITISGEKRAQSDRKDKGYTLSERSYGAFARSIRLPADIDASKSEATFANGVLKVTVPRKAKPQKIEVKPTPAA